jgi:ribosomal protein S26
MGKRRGRDRLMTCVSCGRAVPRDKAVDYERRSSFTTDFRDRENVTAFSSTLEYYCISCAKHRKIFEKKKRIAEKRRERKEGRF